MLRGSTLTCLGLLTLGACASAEPEKPALTYQLAVAEDGLEIAFETTGEGSPALVFVHGWACDREYWREQVAAFGDRTQVVTLDLGGHGDSGATRAHWSMRGLAGDVQAVVERLGIRRAVLVGHSMGGPVSLYAAARMPDRVIGVIGVDTLHNVEAQFNSEMVDAMVANFRDDWEGAMDTGLQMMLHENSKPELHDWILQRTLTNDREAVLEIMESSATVNLVGAMAGLPCPLRCINAAPRPPAIPPTSFANNGKHVDFDAVIMPGVGHYPMLEQPERFNEHLLKLVIELTRGS